MPVSAGRGPLSKAIRNLCYELDQGAITRGQFQAGLGDLINQYRYLGTIVYQDIGLALDYWIRERHKDRTTEYWQLADLTDERIRGAVQRWQRAMSK